MADSGDWLLKILSGPHQGAEEVLRPGRIIVGAHQECDIVLHDVLLAPQHLAFTFGPDGVSVEALEGRVYYQGKRVIAATPVKKFAFVTAGTTHLVLGPASERWPLLSAADAPELEKDPPPSPAPTPAPTPTGSAAGAPDKKPAVPTPEQRRRALWLAGVGGVFLIGWLVLWVTWKPIPERVAPPTAKARAQTVLNAFPGANQVKLEERGDRLTVTGYIASDSEHREMTAAFREEAPEVTVRLWSTPRIAETARAFLADRKLDLTVAPAENGEIKVSGSVGSHIEWMRARQMLLAEVPGLQRINDEIKVTPPAPKGSTPPAPSPSPIPAEPAPGDLKIVALRALGDGQGWVRLANGSVLFRGGRLPGGARVTEVREDSATLERDGEFLTVAAGADLATALRPRPLAAAGTPTDAGAPARP